MLTTKRRLFISTIKIALYHNPNKQIFFIHLS